MNNKLSALKARNFENCGLSEEDIKILEGLECEESYKDISRKVPKGLSDSKKNRFIEDNMGAKAYARYIEASKKLSYLIRREEEAEGLKALKKGIFTEYRAIAYPVHNKIVREGKGNNTFTVKPVVEFGSKEAIYLTNPEGYNEPKHEYMKLLLDELKEFVGNGELGGTTEIVEDDKTTLVFRVTIEAIKAKPAAPSKTK